MRSICLGVRRALGAIKNKIGAEVYEARLVSLRCLSERTDRCGVHRESKVGPVFAIINAVIGGRVDDAFRLELFAGMLDGVSVAYV
jgi:hypothetical protein